MIALNKAKNYVINGALDYWQRGNTFSPLVHTSYFADRFSYNKQGTMVINGARDTDVPTFAQANFTFPYSCSFTVATAQTSFVSNDYAFFKHRIEGQFFAPLAGKRQVLSFWIKSSLVGKYSVALANSGYSRGYVANYTVNAANTWERKTISFTHDTTGTWNYGTGIGLEIGWYFAGGAGFNSPTVNQWFSGGFANTADSVNFVGTVGNVMKITGIQLEEAYEASNFDRSGGFVDNELRLCQRYYEKSFDIDQPPLNGLTSTSFITTAGLERIPCIGNNSALNGGYQVLFKANKRVPATPVIYGNNTGQQAYGSNGTLTIPAASLWASSLVGASSDSVKGFYCSQSLTGSIYFCVAFHWAADAEL